MEVINWYSLLMIWSSKTLQCRCSTHVIHDFLHVFKNNSLHALNDFLSSLILLCAVSLLWIFIEYIYLVSYFKNINILIKFINQIYKHSLRGKYFSGIECKIASFDWNWLVIGNWMSTDTLFYRQAWSCIQIQLAVISK